MTDRKIGSKRENELRDLKDTVLTNEKMLSCPEFTRPPETYLVGLPLQLMKYKQTDIRTVEARKSAKRSQLVNPKMPAAAPAKRADRNLTEFKDA
jgi:tRNA G37 N-methylase TrmD